MYHTRCVTFENHGAVFETLVLRGPVSKTPCLCLLLRYSGAPSSTWGCVHQEHKHLRGPAVEEPKGRSGYYWLLHLLLWGRDRQLDDCQQQASNLHKVSKPLWPAYHGQHGEHRFSVAKGSNRALSSVYLFQQGDTTSIYSRMDFIHHVMGQPIYTKVCALISFLNLCMFQSSAIWNAWQLLLYQEACHSSEVTMKQTGWIKLFITVKKINTTPEDGIFSFPRFIVHGLVARKKYVFRIKSVSAAGISDYSEESAPLVVKTAICKWRKLGDL